MTVSEFKKDYPEYAHLEGDALWDMMTNVALAVGLKEEFPKKLKGKPESFRMVILDFGSIEEPNTQKIDKIKNVNGRIIKN